MYDNIRGYLVVEALEGRGRGRGVAGKGGFLMSHIDFKKSAGPVTIFVNNSCRFLYNPMSHVDCK